MNQKNLHAKTQEYQTVRLWTALVTPMFPDGNVDYENLVIVAKQQAKAANGITLLGSTGEGLALTYDEQLRIVQTVCELALDVPIMVALGGFNLPAQLSWIEQCNQLPIDAYLVASPIYTKPGEVGLTNWFTEILDKSQRPCMIYNVPSRSGVSLPVAVMQNIQDHKNCWAMKEASGDLNTFLRYKEHCPHIELFSGEDAMMPYLAGAGVRGLVSVAANAWPEATNRYVELALLGQHQTLFPVWQQAVASLFQVASPIPVKVLMHMNRLLNHPTLRAPLTEDEIINNPFALKSLKTVDQAINQWLAESQTIEFIENKQIIGVK